MAKPSNTSPSKNSQVLQFPGKIMVPILYSCQLGLIVHHGFSTWWLSQGRHLWSPRHDGILHLSSPFWHSCEATSRNLKILFFSEVGMIGSTPTQDTPESTADGWNLKNGWFVPSLKLTNRTLEMDGWNTISFPFGAPAYFQGLGKLFNIVPEKWWLEDYFPIGMVHFQGLC